jgi:hypothetical protein
MTAAQFTPQVAGNGSAIPAPHDDERKGRAGIAGIGPLAHGARIVISEHASSYTCYMKRTGRQLYPPSPLTACFQELTLRG